MNPNINLYKLFGVRPDATPEEIKAAYRERIRIAHTDVGGTTEAASQLNVAYGILGNDGEHAAYRTARQAWAAKQQAILCRNCGEANRISGNGTPVCGSCKAQLAHPDQFGQFKAAAIEMANEVGTAVMKRLTSELKRRIAQ